MHFVYLHGFNSAYDPYAEKVKDLSIIGTVSGITYDTFGTYDEIKSYLISQVPSEKEIIFVGTSLGAYWASEMGKHFGVPSILINPCYDPANMLARYEGVIMTNYYTAVHNVLTSEAIASYQEKRIEPDYQDYKYVPMILLDMDDEVINSKLTAHIYRMFPMKTFEDGSHRFDHMKESLESIRMYANHCEYVEHLNV